MKKLLSTNLSCKKNLSVQPLLHYLRSGIPLLCGVVLFLALLSGCSKQQPKIQAKDSIIKEDSVTMNSDDDFLTAYKKINESPDNAMSANHEFSWITFWELLQARAATAKYLNFNKAIEDGYTDINVVIPHMGYHYLKSKFLDDKFEITKPEILVYKKNENGKMQLEALEYAVPFDLSADAPEGFAGDHDVWNYDTAFQLWTLHAWVWYFNPDGVFNSTNPLVHVH